MKLKYIVDNIKRNKSPNPWLEFEDFEKWHNSRYLDQDHCQNQK